MRSFGMLLWELSFNKIPYKDLESDDVIDHVMSGKRESLDFGKDSNDIIKGFTKIITSSWQQDYRKRPTMPMVSKILESLYKTYFGEIGPVDYYEQKDDEFASSSKEGSDIDNGNENLLETDDYNEIDFNLDILPLKMGIEYHNTKAKKTETEDDYKICWECFKAHADLEIKEAIYWKGLYLWEGYVEKDQIEAKRLFKIAADANIADAQLRYAFALDLPLDVKEFWKYLNKAAKNDNSA